MTTPPSSDRSCGTGFDRAAGYLLVEVLITLSVSLLALSALIRFQGELFRGDSIARARTHAAILAEQRLETLYASIPTEGLEAVPSGSDTLTADLAPTAAEAAAVYIRSWSVTADPEAGTAQIEVAVTWNDHANNSYDIRLASLFDTAAVTYGAPVLVNHDFIQLPSQ